MKQLEVFTRAGSVFHYWYLLLEWHTLTQSQGTTKQGFDCFLNKGANKSLENITQMQQQIPESLLVTLTWHASKHGVHKLHQKHNIYPKGPMLVEKLRGC